MVLQNQMTWNMRDQEELIECFKTLENDHLYAHAKKLNITQKEILACYHDICHTLEKNRHLIYYSFF